MCIEGVRNDSRVRAGSLVDFPIFRGSRPGPPGPTKREERNGERERERLRSAGRKLILRTMSIALRVDATREVTSSVGVIVRLIASGQPYDARLCDLAFYRAAIRLAVHKSYERE